MSEWQSIDTAPIDGTNFLAVTDEGMTVLHCSFMAKDGPYWALTVNSSYASDNGFSKATHWMPLPKAPDA